MLSFSQLSAVKTAHLLTVLKSKYKVMDPGIRRAHAKGGLKNKIVKASQAAGGGLFITLRGSLKQKVHSKYGVLFARNTG
jgi:hypothetical protein